MNVKSLNFGFQKTTNEYELYLSGHDEYHEEYDTWQLIEIYSPQNNFIGLGSESLSISIDEFKILYKQELLKFSDEKRIEFISNVEFISISYVLGVPEKLL